MMQGVVYVTKTTEDYLTGLLTKMTEEGASYGDAQVRGPQPSWDENYQRWGEAIGKWDDAASIWDEALP